jgi:lipoprotein-anchoring transpeptidase ErfK/SrfK
MILSRRDFLKLSSLALGAALLPPTSFHEALLRPVLWGRTIYLNYIFDQPSLKAQHVGVIPAGSVFGIYDTVQSTDDYYNKVWYRSEKGFVHSASVQPVRWEIQRPTLDLPPEGFFGEISVPFTSAQNGPGEHYNTAYRFYYSTTYWVLKAQQLDDGSIWYQTLDDRTLKTYWVRGEHIRPVSDAELTPIDPTITDKRIEVDLEKQLFRAYQGGQVVLETLVSTGPYLRMENGHRIFGTPAGDWSILRKRPTRHMAGDDAASADFFDLPGVPWVSYFHWWGVSIHGTYWHNDYGRPRSHGCVNMKPEDAKWVYRWTLPEAGIKDKEYLAAGTGTPMIVF